MKITILNILLLGIYAQAAGGEGVPVSLVVYQAINIAILLTLVMILVRPKVKTYFLSRKDAYEVELKKAELARIEAEKQMAEISNKIANIEKNSQAELSKAQSEANQFKAGLIKEAEESAKKILEEASRLASFEVEKAKAEIKREILDSALKAAQQAVQAKMDNKDHQKLQASFIEKVGASKV